MVGANNVLLKKHVRSKYDDLCEVVELIGLQSGPAKVRFEPGREASVSLRDIAPLNCDDAEITPKTDGNDAAVVTDMDLSAGSALRDTPDRAPITFPRESGSPDSDQTPTESPTISVSTPFAVRRSSRSNKGVPPDRYVAS